MIQAQQGLSVQLTAANRELEVAKLQRDAASFQAQAILSKATADRDVIKVNNEAEASVLSDQVKAFGTGMNLSRYVFYQKLGPRISSILSSDSPDGLGGILTPFVPGAKEVK